MRKLVQSELPIQYPLSPAEFYAARRVNQIEKYADTPPPAGTELGLSAFTMLDRQKMTNEAIMKGWLEKEVIERGYTPEQRRLTTDELAYGAGIEPCRFERSLKEPWLTGIPHAFHLGNIEGPHGIILKEMLGRIRKGVHHVLNIGCGPVGFQHMNIEASGINTITYADINVDRTLQTVEYYLHRFGRSDVQRRFLTLDKNDAEAVQRAIERHSITAVIRTGVGRITQDEIKGLNAIMAPGSELFVSNSLTGQPLRLCLDAVENEFQEIEVYIGFERYVLVCKKADSAAAE